MIQPFETILQTIVQPEFFRSILAPVNVLEQFEGADAHPVQKLNAAFLVALSGNSHSAYTRAMAYIDSMGGSAPWSPVSDFYRLGIERIPAELEMAAPEDPELSRRMSEVSAWLKQRQSPSDDSETIERIWSLFFPEGYGVLGSEAQRIEALRRARRITITALNPEPITDPARQILFTSNVLLTLPATSRPLDSLVLPKDQVDTIRQAALEPQDYWYDHPIPIGIPPENNEIIYGLRGLAEALRYERSRGNTAADAKLTCVLSVSVTHRRLQEIAKAYLESLLQGADGLEDMEIYMVSESETQQMIKEVLAPAARRYLQAANPEVLLDIFGVNGEYGRHYSFLKAAAALWQVFVRPELKATFKIDLDQIFPQKELVEESSGSAFEHLTSPLWGARGLDSGGQPVELGMIAGALVNQRDIQNSLFTPDVGFPDGPSTPDEIIFFSQLPQALSTQAEMMTRYDQGDLDGIRACIQRIHVTGGTNGILIDALRRHRPFTPSFIGRAEDQAYILSMVPSKPTGGMRLAYAHEDGLIMRHDKEVFAQEAIHVAQIGKLVGDYLRILSFSAYVRALTADIASVKARIDPFTGCFISRIPITVVYLRFALKAASLFSEGKIQQGVKFIINGSDRIPEAIAFAFGADERLTRQYLKESEGWHLYYDTLSAIELENSRSDPFARELFSRFQAILKRCHISPKTNGIKRP